jgi:putative aldouronate transport system permease protein
MKLSTGERIFGIVNYVLLSLAVVVTLAPFLHVLAKSVSRESAVMAGQVTLWPIGFNLKTYRVVLGGQDFWRAFRVSVFVTITGTLLHVLVTGMAAYVLSRVYLVGRRFLTFLFVFTMLFSGGLIPTYLVVRRLGLVGSLWALILPSVVSTFNLIVLRNYFSGIPKDLEESAKLDGASNLTVFFKIMFPLAMPSIATISLFTAVGLWNNYFGAMIYVNQKSMYPLSLYLRSVVVDADADLVNLNPEIANLNPESVRSATVMAATVPILLVYPLLQRYFVTGMTLGAVKS